MMQPTHEKIFKKKSTTVYLYYYQLKALNRIKKQSKVTLADLIRLAVDWVIMEVDGGKTMDELSQQVGYQSKEYVDFDRFG